MASPQTEDGYTPVANEILERIAKLPLNGTQWRIIAVVWRYTYGFSRKSHEISESYIAKAIDIDRRNVRREMATLISKNIIEIVQDASFTNPRIIKFNKNYDSWVGANSPPEGKKNTEGENATPPGGEFAPSPRGSIHPPRKQIYKTNIKQDVHLFFESLWKLYPNKKGKGQISDSKKQALYKIGLEELSRAIDRYLADLKKDEWRKPQNASTFFNSGYVDYLDANYNTVPAARKGDDYFADVL